MRWWWPVIVLLLAGGVVLIWSAWGPGPVATKPLPVPDGDHEVAWLHTSTSAETWEDFVWGMKRTEMKSSGAPSGISVDVSAAYPVHTTVIPEIVVSREGFAGKLRVRWYKVTNEVTTDAWVKALAERSPSPLAIIGGWSSDRAKELAVAMAETDWPGQKPALLLSTATADSVYPDVKNYSADYQPPKLIGLYNRSFRLCFTNRQMAEAVADFVLTDPGLRPGPAVLPGLRAVPGAVGGGWAVLPWLAPLNSTTPGVPAFRDAQATTPGIPAFAVVYADDPYSLDLANQFTDVFRAQSTIPGRPGLTVDSIFIPFSVGRFARANPYEAQVVDQILSVLPHRGERTILVIPTVTTPARRVMRALAQGTPGAARRLVAVTGDGIPVNALFRDGDFAWPVRAIPIPLVLFTHTDPFDWDEPSDHVPPRGYALPPPSKPGDVKNSTEDIQQFTTISAVLARGAFPDGSGRVVEGSDALVANFHSLSPTFFDPSGNRLTGSGEHVVVLRPTPRLEGVVTYPDAVLEVWTRQDRTQWNRIHSRPVVQTIRPHDGMTE